MKGLCGAHRTGKTTLARAYAQKHGAAFLETSVSAIFRDLGYDPAAVFDFSTRLTIQEEVLKRVDAVYARVDPSANVITDRTPLDMLGYTLAEAIGDSVQHEDQVRLANYARDCFDVTNKRFSTIVLVQPGIVLEPAAGKAVLNPAYIEHLNSLILGLTVDERLRVAHFYLPRHVLSLEGRIGAVENAVGRSLVMAQHSLTQHLSEGGMVQ